MYGCTCLCVLYTYVYSVGSLGAGGADDRVEEVHVRNCNFTGTQNGARIKTFPVMRSCIRKL